MKEITAWAQRIRAVVSTTDGNYSSLRAFVDRTCPYGGKHFCDGSTNKTMQNPSKENKPPCKYFSNGKCDIELHKRNRTRLLRLKEEKETQQDTP